jgi:hypothetical protein
MPPVRSCRRKSFENDDEWSPTCFTAHKKPVILCAGDMHNSNNKLQLRAPEGFAHLQLPELHQVPGPCLGPVL